MTESVKHEKCNSFLPELRNYDYYKCVGFLRNVSLDKTQMKLARGCLIQRLQPTIAYRRRIHNAAYEIEDMNLLNVIYEPQHHFQYNDPTKESISGMRIY